MIQSRREDKERLIGAAYLGGLIVVAWLVDQVLAQGHYTWLALRVPIALTHELLGLPPAW